MMRVYKGCWYLKRPCNPSLTSSVFPAQLCNVVPPMPLRFDCSSLSGLFITLLSVVLALGVIFVLPATFWMVLWNAVVFEGLHGPFIALHQGFLLWIATLIVFKLLFNLQIMVVWDEWDGEDTSTPSGSVTKSPTKKPNPSNPKAPKPPKV